MSRSIKDILKDIVIRNTPFANRLEICVLDCKDKRIIKERITLGACEMAIALMEYMMVDNEGWIKVNNHETITTYNFSKTVETVEAEARLKELQEKQK